MTMMKNLPNGGPVQAYASAFAADLDAWAVELESLSAPSMAALVRGFAVRARRAAGLDTHVAEAAL